MKVLFLIVLAAMNLVYGQKCGTFRPPEFGQQKLVADFRPTVFRVVSGNEVGSAFLVDPEHGFFLTAAHVIKASIDDDKVPITLSHENYGDAVFNAHHVSNTNDVALLQLDSSGTLSELVSPDISFETPPQTELVTVFGYGNEGDDKTLTAQPAPVLASSGDEAFSASMSAFYGDSGGPAINKYGQVVGVGVEYLSGSLVAKFVPMVAIRNLLDRIPPTTRTLKIDTQLKANGYTKQALTVLLTPSAGRLSNLEWYTWALFVSERPAQEYAKLKAFSPVLLRMHFGIGLSITHSIDSAHFRTIAAMLAL
jgi:hypothetical protein